MAWKFLLGYIIIDTSRAQEFIKILGTLQVQKICALFAIAGVLFTPGLLTHLKNNLKAPQTKILFFLIFWMLMSVPFGVWPGASFGYIKGSLWKVTLLCLVIIVYGTSQEKLSRIIWSYLIGILMLGIFSLFLINMHAPEINTTYDRNEIALQFVIAVPLAFWQMIFSKGISKALSFVICLAAPIIILLTQSRGGFLGLVVVLAIMIFQSGRFSMKSLFVFSTLLALTGVIIFFSMEAIHFERLLTLFNPREDYNITAEEGRLRVWGRGINLMLSNPILGVGINGFISAEGMSHQTFKWSAAHNCFLQVGAELGFPGLISYILILYFCMKTASSNWPRVSAQHNNIAALNNLKSSLKAAWIGFIITGFFLSVAFSQAFFFLFAISTICQSLLRPQGLNE